MPDPNYVSEIEREDGTLLTIKDAEARAAIGDMSPTLQQILQGVNDIKSSIGDVGEIVEEVLVGPPTLIEKNITENGTYDASDDEADGYSSVTVNVSGGGGGSDVKFYDYDGTVVASYSAADFANLSAMPANPTHAGLTAQGWNWTLADAKTYVAAYGKLNIGQMYITSDGKTRLYHTITKDSLTVYFSPVLNENTELDIDWGDGSEHTTWTSDDGSSSQYHAYTSAGNYVIAITVVSGGFTMPGYDGSGASGIFGLYKIEFGIGVTEIASLSFNQCTTFKFITIPNSVISIGDDAFYYCTALTSITIPNSVTSIGYSAFNNCTALTSITIPNSVTSIGYSAFYYCYALSSITIPDSVTSIEDSAVCNCSSISSITIPDSVTSIDSYAFQNCYSISSITIPDSVTSIGNSAFYSCYALSSVTFEPSTPPVLNGDLQLPATCTIRVPQGTLSDYTSAENYPDPSEYIYEEY